MGISKNSPSHKAKAGKAEERPTEEAMPRGQPGGGGVLPYMGYIRMCRCEGYGFQAVYSSMGYINQSVWV